MPKLRFLAPFHGSQPSPLPYPFKPVHLPLVNILCGTLQFKALTSHRCSHLAKGLTERRVRGLNLDRRAPRKYKAQIVCNLASLPSSPLPPPLRFPPPSVPSPTKTVPQCRCVLSAYSATQSGGRSLIAMILILNAQHSLAHYRPLTLIRSTQCSSSGSTPSPSLAWPLQGHCPLQARCFVVPATATMASAYNETRSSLRQGLSTPPSMRCASASVRLHLSSSPRTSPCCLSGSPSAIGAMLRRGESSRRFSTQLVLCFAPTTGQRHWPGNYLSKYL